MYQLTTIVGNLGNDPEMKEVGNSSVCSFSVAVNEFWVDRTSGERRERTTWFNVSAWEKLGENCFSYLARGQQVFITGRVTAYHYTDRDGNIASGINLRANKVVFGSRGGKREDVAPPARNSQQF